VSEQGQGHSLSHKKLMTQDKSMCNSILGTLLCLQVHLGPVLGRGEFGVTYKATWRGATVSGLERVRCRAN
jgi:hypothetical protein